MKHASRGLKMVVSLGAIVALSVLLAPRLPSQILGSELNSTVAYAARPLPIHGKHVFAIVYVTPTGLPPGTLQELHGLHASGVLLYAAWYSDAFFPIKNNPYGVVSPAASLPAAVEELQQHGYSVVGVISSALFDKVGAPRSQAPLVQRHPDSNSRYGVFDPIAAHSFVVSLGESLVRASHLAGMYVGEPYFITTRQARKDGPAAFQRLYSALLQKARVPEIMIVPYSYHAYTRGLGVGPIDRRLSLLRFAAFGVDGEYADMTASRSSDLGYLSAMAETAKTLAGKRPSMVELSLENARFSAFVSPALFKEELTVLQRHSIQDVVIFAAEFWLKAPRRVRATYGQELQSFLSRGAPAAQRNG